MKMDWIYHPVHFSLCENFQHLTKLDYKEAPQSRDASIVYTSCFDKLKQFVLLNRIEILKAIVLAYGYPNLA